VEVVKGSLIGSIISNLLLVLGFCFFCGGLKYKQQTFNAEGAGTQNSLLLLAALALAIPTIVNLAMAGGLSADSELWISRGCAIVLAFLYLLYLYFQLVTHPEIFVEEGGEEEEAELGLSTGGAISVLLVSTAMVAACSESLTGAVEGVTKSLGISESFVGIVLLPIVGNAAEHLTAVTVAVKDKMDLSVGVALGSSTQIALFVVPFTVLAGWSMGVPMDLDFTVLPAAVMLLTVLIVGSTVTDGRSNWLEGAMLIAAYILIAVAFWFV